MLGRRTPRSTPRSSGTCSRAGSTSPRPSSSACSSRSRTGTRRSSGRWRPLATSSTVADVWETITAEAAHESRIWGETLRPPAERDETPVFSRLGEPRFALGLETIYEGYLLHYGRPRLFAPADADTALLLGDYLYAHGLVRVSQTGSVDAVADLAALISLCAQLRAEEGGPGDAYAWAASAALLGQGRLGEARVALRDRGDPAPLERLARDACGDDAVDGALAAHGGRVE